MRTPPPSWPTLLGHTRTAPAAGSDPGRITFGLASCQSWAGGRYADDRTMAQEDLDLVVHVGLTPMRARITRRWPTSATSTPSTRARSTCRAHARFPFVVTSDDHQVENNWANGVSQPDNEPSHEPQRFLQLRANAYQAYYGHLPLRRPHGSQAPTCSCTEDWTKTTWRGSMYWTRASTGRTS